MNRSVRFILILASAFSIALIAVSMSRHQVYASVSPSIVITNGPGINICSNTFFSVRISVNASAAFSDHASMTVPGLGSVFSFSENDAPGSWVLYNINPSSYSVAANTSITVSITTYNGLNQSGGISYVSTAVINCSTGIASSVSGGSPAGNFGVGVPSGFVLHTITCTIAVYDSAGGGPVSGTKIISGQTWFVNPTPVRDAKGEHWTEIFVGGPIDGFIPTTCVN
jgi:hypothetical protein